MTGEPLTPRKSDTVPMTREELEEVVASAICCHTRMSPAVQWEIDLVMQAIDKHVELRLHYYAHELAEKVRDAVQCDDPDEPTVRGASWAADLVDQEAP